MSSGSVTGVEILFVDVEDPLDPWDSSKTTLNDGLLGKLVQGRPRASVM